MESGPLVEAKGDEPAREKKSRWSENKVYTRKIRHKKITPQPPSLSQSVASQSIVPDDGVNSSQQQNLTARLDAAASDNSSNHRQVDQGKNHEVAGNQEVLPAEAAGENGSVSRSDNNGTFNLSSSSRSKQEVRERRKKLISELQQVRGLLKQLEAKELEVNKALEVNKELEVNKVIDVNEVNDDDEVNGVNGDDEVNGVNGDDEVNGVNGYTHSQFSANDGVENGEFSRINSEAENLRKRDSELENGGFRTTDYEVEDDGGLRTMDYDAEDDHGLRGMEYEVEDNRFERGNIEVENNGFRRGNSEVENNGFRRENNVFRRENSKVENNRFRRENLEVENNGIGGGSSETEDSGFRREDLEVENNGFRRGNSEIENNGFGRMNSEVGNGGLRRTNSEMGNGGFRRTTSEVGNGGFRGTISHLENGGLRNGLSRSLQVAVGENGYGHGQSGASDVVEKRTPKANQYYRNSDYIVGKEKFPTQESNKKLKTSKKHGTGGKAGHGFGLGIQYCKVFKTCNVLLSKLMRHNYGWVFNSPVDVKALGLHDYYHIIKHPMDLGTVKSRLYANVYQSPRDFAEDVRLTFSNAMTYNPKGQDVHIMAEVLSKMFEDEWADMENEYDLDSWYEVERELVLPSPTMRKAPPPPVHQEMRRVERLDSTSQTVDYRPKPAYSAPPVRAPALKKPKAKDLHKRDMTYEEKQKLSSNLENLPSEKLDNIVQIIKKRNSSFFQNDDELEVDIDSVDVETLWELDRFVTNYKKSLSKYKRKAELALQAREADRRVKERNLAPVPAGVPMETDKDGKNASTSLPIQVEKQGDNASRSSSSSSSSSDSGSSSSDSDSDSSSGSDAGNSPRT